MDIPLVIDDQPDAFTWNEERNGLYTVRSGYRFIMWRSLKEERSCREIGAVCGELKYLLKCVI